MPASSLFLASVPISQLKIYLFQGFHWSNAMNYSKKKKRKSTPLLICSNDACDKPFEELYEQEH